MKRISDSLLSVKTIIGAGRIVKVLLTPLLMVLVLTSPATGSSLEFSLFGGYSKPFGRFGDLAQSGKSVGVFAGLYTRPYFELGVGASINSFNTSETLDKLTSGVDLSILELTSFGKFLFLPEKPFTPFARVMVGLFRNGVESETDFDQESETSFGFGGGFGAQLGFSNSVGIFVETVTFLQLNDSDTAYLTIRGGLQILKR